MRTPTSSALPLWPVSQGLISTLVEAHGQEMEKRGACYRRANGRHGKDAVTNVQLREAINESVKDFAILLRFLAEEASGRLTHGEDRDSLKKSFQYATHVLAIIEKEKPD